VLLPLVLAGSLALAAHAPSAPRDGTYVGATSEHRKIRIVVEDGQIARTAVTINSYRCDPEGQVGPVVLRVRPHAPIVERAVSFDSGTMVNMLRLRATFGSRTRMSGSVRAHGTIGTGDPCTSPVRRFTAKRR
jgi:hypothetical protein